MPEIRAESLARLLRQNENWLIKRVIEYAKQNDYVKYTSTLEEAWRISISGLTTSIVGILEKGCQIPHLSPDENISESPAGTFGVIEARKHRSRGITLEMFLGLMKYYRQSYLDLIRESALPVAEREYWRQFLDRVFDRIEIAFISEWSGRNGRHVSNDLMAMSREMTNEKNKYLTIFESMANPVILLDDRGLVDNLNHAAMELFFGGNVPGQEYYRGLKRASGTPALTAFPWLAGHLESAMASPGRYDFEIVLADEEKRFYEVRLEKMLDVSDKFRGTVISLTDVTERKLIEEAQRARLLRMLDSSKNELYLIDTSSLTLLYANAEGKRNLGITEEGVQNFGALNLLDNEYEAVLLDHINKLLALQETTVAFEAVHHRPNGQSYPIEVRLQMQDDKDHVLLVEVLDISERKAKDEQLRQSQKMEALGRLAGGIVHDFNNILTVIKGYNDLAANSAHGKVLDYTRQVGRATDRAIALTGQMKSFSRSSDGRTEVLDVDALINDTCQMVLPIIGDNISLTVCLEGEPPRVLAERTQLEQILINLIVNAKEAMPLGGKIIVRRAEGTATDTDPLVNATISVMDTGVGMTQEVQERIFEPFFTTKAHGTGLGLAITYDIVKRLGGQILVTSEVNRGTRFDILVPKTSLPLPSTEKAENTKEPPLGPWHILVVEDQEAIRSLLRDFLVEEGHQVKVAASVGEVAKLTNNRFDLVITDLMLPDGGGASLIGAMGSRQPSTRFILMSGLEEVTDQGNTGGHDFIFLAKPFSMADLKEKIQSTMASVL